MKTEKDMPSGYYILWVIVIAIGILVYITHGVYLVGQGRWECTEWKTYEISKCDIDKHCMTTYDR